ncbi:MAG: ankyrin repeat domain-containing protein [Ferruginibacter sp.]
MNTKTHIILVFAFCLLVTNKIQAQSTTLIEAVRNNDISEVKSFLQKGADVNAYDDDSDNVLINAAMYASADCMKLLLTNKANPNLANKYGQTPLMVSTNDLNKVKLLVRFGAQINDTAKSGNNALLIACENYGTHDVIIWLLDHGANPLQKRWSAETALMRAALFADTATINILLGKGFDINAHPWGFTPLMYAIRNGNWPAVICLVNHGADVNIADDNKNLPVGWAAVADNTDAVNKLLPLTKSINLQDERSGMTPLMWATYNEHDNPGIIQAFLDKGADINIKAKNGSTALSWALKKGNTQTVALLRKAGATE